MTAVMIHVCGAGPLYEIPAGRRGTVRFTFHWFGGPTFYKRDGDTIICAPTPWHWRAFEKWIETDEGKRRCAQAPTAKGDEE